MMKFRKPEPVPLLFLAATLALLLSLGAWQVQRLQWKNALIADIQSAQALPPLTILPASVEELDYRHVMLTGRFHYDKAMQAIGPAPGVTGVIGTGFHLLTPFTLEDGRTILVNRGWAPSGRETHPEGLQTVHGIIRPLRPKALFAPENRPDRNIWFYDNLPAMEDHTGLKLTPIIVQAVAPMEKGVYPIPSDGKIVLRNDHRNYAITWFSLAVIALVMFAFYHRKIG